MHSFKKDYKFNCKQFLIQPKANVFLLYFVCNSILIACIVIYSVSIDFLFVSPFKAKSPASVLGLDGHVSQDQDVISAHQAAFALVYKTSSSTALKTESVVFLRVYQDLNTGPYLCFCCTVMKVRFKALYTICFINQICSCT